MDVGKELDAQIASEVFRHGIYLVNIGSNSRPHMVYSYTKDPTPYDDHGCLTWDPDDFVPEYSRDILHAWKIAEHIGLSKGAFTLTQHPIGFIGLAGIFDCGFGQFVGRSTSATHAICLAALKTVDIK